MQESNNTTKLSRDLVLYALTTLLQELKPISQKLQIVGSVRRLKPFVKDVELLCIPKFETRSKTQVFTTGSNLLAFTTLKDQPKEIRHTFNLVEERLSHLSARKKLFFKKNGVTYKQFEWYYDKRKGPESMDHFIIVDFWYAEHVNFGIKELIRTGPAAFSKAFVTWLNRKTDFKAEKGYLKTKDGEIIPVRTEEEVFQKVGLDYIPIGAREEYVFKFY